MNTTKLLVPLLLILLSLNVSCTQKNLIDVFVKEGISSVAGATVSAKFNNGPFTTSSEQVRENSSNMAEEFISTAAFKWMTVIISVVAALLWLLFIGDSVGATTKFVRQNKRRKAISPRRVFNKTRKHPAPAPVGRIINRRPYLPASSLRPVADSKSGEADTSR